MRRAFKVLMYVLAAISALAMFALCGEDDMVSALGAAFFSAKLYAIGRMA